MQADDPALSSHQPIHTQPGQVLARGVCRHLRTLDVTCLEEMVPTRGLRVDVMGLGPKGAVWVVECKSSRADFISDSKWQGYLPWCDRYFFAVNPAFPVEILPEETGLIIADGYGAEIIRMPDEVKLPAARRKALHLSFARQAALRLQSYRDPGVAALFGG
ncbi:MmcB family DNA repair protein [Celeribacter baekdonensis]|uniref:MmcB family DNA repair protein n=1 Tax=Celeribacter baekdonensis TaxID=875171 RepID=UPI003A8DC663